MATTEADAYVSETKENGRENEGGAVQPVENLAASPPTVNDAVQKTVDAILYSDIGVNTLLNRLKQSVASARDFAGFLRKRGAAEEEHSKELRKLVRHTQGQIRSPDSRQGTYATQFEELSRTHERMADHGMQYALSMHTMHEDLTELANNMERGRKHWKQVGLAAEKKVQDAEALMDKAKSKYASLAEDYDGVRTGDRSSGRHLFRPKNEEDMLRKVQAADSDYASKVQQAQSDRQELISSHRPAAVRALQDLIKECDSALTLQLQKYATFNEKLLVGNGMLIAPIKSQEIHAKSMKDIVHQIDNEKDFQTYIVGLTSKVPAKPVEIKYEKHPSLQPTQQPPANNSPAPPIQTSLPQAQPPAQFPMGQQGSRPPPQQGPPTPTGGFQQMNPGYQNQPSPVQPPQPQEMPSQQIQYPSQAPPYPHGQPNQPYPAEKMSADGARPPSRGPGAPQLAPLGFEGAHHGHPNPPTANVPTPTQSQPPPMDYKPGVAPPNHPVFGVSLDALYQRDGTPVPLVVYQCVQAVDLYGLEVEGIYRVPGDARHIQQLKSLFNHDSSRVDFRNPEAFYHDVNSVAGLLKLWLRELPDPVLTSERESDLIGAARIQDYAMRRDSIHAIVNELPDPNYATLRAVVLHLHKIQERSAHNRMTSENLAICFAPTLMGNFRGPNVADAGLQATVIDTILQNTFQIFDED
ncbi:RhoGAP-domain-containing protein [Eremomyces bilateralis CBS 781.70]|uniref:RhoGAP-domain-containing protein n=1 Tax=Eremomyces bilateralis CBS 781.70 TaxID=1392243 RepID=A0A6G1G8S7_9PEZI|nr:RhoGAP-domain-containing protein [Eremomyces bilateralis CBS 781.70]KAF1814478.1 RhoGAP-domain-containing protein [Eremomyces bilateralis CBS 781.70]